MTSEEPALLTLVDEARNIFLNNKATSVLPKSIPVLFFGDLSNYWNPYPRIITVGRNPSFQEFPLNQWNCRFERSEVILRKLTGNSENWDDEARGLYLTSLKKYFATKRHKWFQLGFGGFLEGMGKSYLPLSPSNVVHTDFCSPLATRPSWSSLGDGEKKVLMRDGVHLWYNLETYLDPDIIVISIGNEYSEWLMGRFTVVQMDSYPYEATIGRKKVTVEAKLFQCERGNKTKWFVEIPLLQNPFGVGVTNEAKKTIAKSIRSRISSAR
ncbi:MAG: hypothetical protein OK422_04355 [Thaumarchaeota archaeon]|nr:hypothetical protein [Nitrososphaerota archaeon]